MAKQEQFNSFNITVFLLTDILLANGDEPNLRVPAGKNQTNS